MYDYLIVGSGLSGCVFAYCAGQKGKKCLVVERKNEIGGVCRTDNRYGITVHSYGAHIFRTSSKRLWEWVNAITPFVPFMNTPKAINGDVLLSMPINMNTFHELWGVKTPAEAEAELKRQIVPCENPKNLKDFILSKVGRDIYDLIFKDYTEKQWGAPCEELPPETIRRIPIRMTYNNNYYDKTYQGIPERGYTEFMSEMLRWADVVVNQDGISYIYYDDLAKEVVYTGAIDELFQYRFGELEYRSLEFTHELKEVENYQGVAVVNHTGKEVPYTRTIEHKHFLGERSDRTIVTFEKPVPYGPGKERYYPMGDEKNQALYERYRALVPDRIHLLGRLAEYRYTDMAETIEAAAKLAERIIR